MVESGTGTGKTICALSGSLQAALEQDKKVIYLTRTNSQQRQVMLELRKINRSRPVLGVGLQGRQSTCPLIQRDPDLRGGTPEELYKLCAEQKARSRAGKTGGCRFYEAVLSTDFTDVEHYFREELPTVEEFITYCEGLGLCPHELIKDLLPKANVVTAPYAFFFMPFIRHNLLDWMNIPISDAVVIVDEAHNLLSMPGRYARSRYPLDSWTWWPRRRTRQGTPRSPKGKLPGHGGGLPRRLQEALEEFLIEDDGLILLLSSKRG